MQKLLFFCRVVFICNVCFALAWFLKYFPEWQNGVISSTILVLGVGIATGLNIIINVVLLVIFMVNRSVLVLFPRWLIIANLIFLIFQLIILLK